MVILLALSTLFIIKNLNKEKEIDSEITSEIKKSAYRINSNSLEKFDLYFLQLENGKQNKIYSPLSIKYALEMLEEGTTGESKAQISNIIGSYKANKYVNSKNMAFGNAIFINEFYKDSIKNEYASNLKNKYNAAVITTPFDSPNEVNSWISNNTLGLINNLYNDISQNNFLLLNALAIDMEWEEKFIPQTGEVEFAIYKHENFYWSGGDELIPKNFKDMDEEVSTMEIIASFNNYDIVKELGKENIRKKVKEEYLKYLEDGGYIELYEYEIYLGEKINGLSEEEIKEKYLDEYIEKFLDKYIEDIDSNYKRVDKITDFSLYVDDDVKVFAKDLKKYNGSQLQYVAIMPTNEDLDNYISKVKVETINKYIENLKKLKADNFKEGVVTKISGFIPKFKFEYQLDLMNDELSFISKFLVRYVWRFLSAIAGFKEPTSPANSYKKGGKIDQKLNDWANEHKMLLICGHTHRAKFPKIGEGLYFNDGSCVFPNSITTIEINKGLISLVKWSVEVSKENNLYIKRNFIAGPEKLEAYLKFVNK